MKSHLKRVIFTLYLAVWGCFNSAHAEETVSTRLSTPVFAVDRVKTYSGDELQQETQTATVGNPTSGPYSKTTRQCGGGSGRAVGSADCPIVSEEFGTNAVYGASLGAINGTVQGNQYHKIEYSTNKDDPAAVNAETRGASGSANISGSKYGVDATLIGVERGIESTKIYTGINDGPAVPAITKSAIDSTLFGAKNQTDVMENKQLKTQTTTLTTGNTTLGPSVTTHYFCSEAAVQSGQRGADCPVVKEALEGNFKLGKGEEFPLSGQLKFGVSEKYSRTKSEYESAKSNKKDELISNYARTGEEGSVGFNSAGQPSKVVSVYGRADAGLDAKVGKSSISLAGAGVGYERKTHVFAEEDALREWDSESAKFARENIRVMKKYDRSAEFQRFEKQIAQDARARKQAATENHTNGAQQNNGGVYEALSIVVNTALQIQQMNQERANTNSSPNTTTSAESGCSASKLRPGGVCTAK